jgi:hypothetical protein
MRLPAVAPLVFIAADLAMVLLPFAFLFHAHTEEVSPWLRL